VAASLEDQKVTYNYSKTTTIQKHTKLLLYYVANYVTSFSISKTKF